MKAKHGGGKGKLIIDWWTPQDSPANLYAFVELEHGRIWLIKTNELPKLAQQKPKGKFHFFMCVDPTASPRKDGKSLYDFEFAKYLLENRIHNLF